jgi:uncharacterized protein (DUF58 family)
MKRFSISGSGRGLIAGAVFLYAVGVALGYTVLTTMAVGALAVLVVAGLAVVVRPAVTLTRRVTPDRVTVGEAALGRVDVQNRSRYPAPGFVVVDRVATTATEIRVGGLPGGGSRTLHYPVRTARRGRIRLGPLTVEIRDPLGLFAWAQRQAGDSVLWVHPRVHTLRALAVGLVPDYEGRATEYARAGTVAFSSLRDYVPGDDPRHIHWRSTARTGTLVVREHVDTTEPTTTVLLDARGAVFGGDSFEPAVELAASIVHSVEEAGRPAVLRVFGQDESAVAAAGAVSTGDRLALAEPVPHGDPVHLLEALDRLAAGGALVIVTGHVEADMLARLADQRRRFNPVVVVTMLDAGTPCVTGIQRRPGMAVLTARTIDEATGAWHRLVNGDIG